MTLRVTTKDENSRGGSRRINNLVAIFEGELSHGIVEKDLHQGVQAGCGTTA
jgi:hypothetical protein